MTANCTNCAAIIGTTFLDAMTPGDPLVCGVCGQFLQMNIERNLIVLSHAELTKLTTQVQQILTKLRGKILSLKLYNGKASKNPDSTAA